MLPDKMGDRRATCNDGVLSKPARINNSRH